MKALPLAVLVVVSALARGALAQDGNLPPGHPPVGPSQPSAPSAGDQAEEAVIPNSVMAAKDLPAGTIEAKIVDQREQPLAGVDVRLGILRQTVAEGEERTHRSVKSDKDGIVRFAGLETGTDHSYA